MIGWSDHVPITLDILLFAPFKTQRMWCLDSTILNDPKNLDHIEKRPQVFLDNNDIPGTDQTLLWNTYKAFKKAVLVKLTARYRRQRRLLVDSLLQSIRHNDQLNKTNPSCDSDCHNIRRSC